MSKTFFARLLNVKSLGAKAKGFEGAPDASEYSGSEFTDLGYASADVRGLFVLMNILGNESNSLRDKHNAAVEALRGVDDPSEADIDAIREMRKVFDLRVDDTQRVGKYFERTARESMPGIAGMEVHLASNGHIFVSEVSQDNGEIPESIRNALEGVLTDMFGPGRMIVMSSSSSGESLGDILAGLARENGGGKTN